MRRWVVGIGWVAWSIGGMALIGIVWFGPSTFDDDPSPDVIPSPPTTVQAERPTPACRTHTMCAAGVDELITWSGMCTPSAATMVDDIPTNGDTARLLVSSNPGAEVRVYRPQGGPPMTPPIWLRIDHANMNLEAATTHHNVAWFSSAFTRAHNGAYKDAQHMFVSIPGVPNGTSKQLWVSEKTDRFIPALERAPGQLPDRFARNRPGGDGIHVEGLTVIDNRVLFGLRSPLSTIDEIPHALVVPLPNWQPLIEQQANQAEYDPVIPLNLNGRGIRGMAHWPGTSRQLLLAGPSNKRPKGAAGADVFALYLWHSPDSTEVDFLQVIETPPNQRPDALVVLPHQTTEHRAEVLLIFDNHRSCTPEMKPEDQVFHGWRFVIDLAPAHRVPGL